MQFKLLLYKNVLPRKIVIYVYSSNAHMPDENSIPIDKSARAYHKSSYIYSWNQHSAKQKKKKVGAELCQTMFKLGLAMPTDRVSCLGKPLLSFAILILSEFNTKRRKLLVYN